MPYLRVITQTDGFPHVELGLIFRHVTGTTGSFGAAAAMARLLKLSSQQFTFALGHAASLAGGTRAANGTDTKTLHMGRGAQNGILAAVLAQQGFDTGESPVEYWSKLVSTTVSTTSMTNDLGETWELLENTFKPYPCGIVIHPLIDGCLAAHQSGLKFDSIGKIKVIVNPQCMRLCFIQQPKTALEAIFSLYHGCAVALIYGQAGPKQFSDNVCNEKVVISVRDKIEVSIDEFVRDDEAHLRFILNDGTQTEEHVEHAKGSLANSLTREELEAKFLDQSEGPIGVDKCKQVMEMCWTLDTIADISQLLKLCRAS
jgi:aconitate decarboxylase